MSSPEPNPNPGAAQLDPQQRVHELEMQLATERAAHEFDLPAVLLGMAQTPEDIERIASEALLWRAETAPPPPTPPAPQTGAVDASWANGVGTIGRADRMLPQYQQIQTRDAVSRMSPAEILSAWRSGRLTPIGVGAPTRNGSTPLTRRGPS
jgi:hypothetical protein